MLHGARADPDAAAIWFTVDKSGAVLYNETMIKVLFVCLGNICRSPTAELVFKKLVADAGLADEFCIDSCGSSDEEDGNPIYPPALRVLNAHGIDGSHRARQITYDDAESADYIAVMDERNRSDVLRRVGYSFRDKVFKLGDFDGEPHDIFDPWFTRNFERAYDEIYRGCEGLLEYIIKNSECGIDPFRP